MAIYFILILFAFTQRVDSSKKLWIPNTNFDNGANWNLGRKPCSTDRVIIPKDDPVSIFVPENVFAREIILSQNGELILPIQGEISLGSKRSDGCNGADSDILFRVRNVRNWYDPTNWKISEDSGSDGRLSEGRREITDVIPQSEKVPCPTDSVVFPSNSTFSVRVDAIEAIVARFQINGKNLDSDGLRGFLTGESGRKQFRVESKLSLNSHSDCSDVSGCSCGNDNPDVMRRICSHLERRNGCSISQCKDPIFPVGSCCSVCGSTITVTPDEYFQFTKLKELYKFYLEKPYYETVSGYMFKTYLGQIVTVFYDPSKSHRSKKLVDDIQKLTLQNDFERARLNVVSYKIESTTDWSRSSDTFSSSNGLGTGFWIVFIFGLISLAIIGFLFFIQRAQLMPIAFPFGRFDNEYDGGLEHGVELTATVNPGTESFASVDSNELKGFDNPYYDASNNKDNADIKDLSAAAAGKSYETLHTRQNPCYLAFERVEDLPSVPDGNDDVSKSEPID